MPGTSDIHVPKNGAHGGAEPHTGEIRKLTSLLEVSQALANATNFRTSLQRVLEILERSHDAVRGAVALSSSDQLPLEVAASVGAGRDRSWQIGMPAGALARQVFSTGRPVVVPRTSREPAFGERSSGDPERPFVCVPLLLNRRATGVPSAELRFKPEPSYELTGTLFGGGATMIT